MDSDRPEDREHAGATCVACGGIRKFLAKLPEIGSLPEVSIFECLDCGLVDYLGGAKKA